MAHRNRLGGKASEIDRAQESEPHRGGPGDTEERPAGGKKHEAGPERKYDPEAWNGNPNDKNPISSRGRGGMEHNRTHDLPHHAEHGRHTGADLGHAMKHLHSEHPIDHDELGPHHGKKHHVRHEPLHGMHPKAHHGRRK